MSANPNLIADDDSMPNPDDDPMQEHISNPEKEEEEDEGDLMSRSSGEEDETYMDRHYRIAMSANPFRKEVKDFKLVFPYAYLLNIESVNLSIKAAGAGAPRRREIFGKIMVTGRLSKVFALFRRESDQPEIIAEGESRDLTLCGPMYSLISGLSDHIYIRLYERGSDGSDVTFLNKDMYIAIKEDKISLEKEHATLTVHCTELYQSVPFKITISPPVREGPPRTLFGDVKAIQTVSTSLNRTFALFHRSAENGVQLAAGEHIPLDRSLVLSPVQNDVVGPSLTIVVNLCFVDQWNGFVNKLNGSKTFVFRSNDLIRSFPIRDTFPLKHNHPDLDDSSSSDVPDKLEIMVSPYFDSSIGPLEDEEDEYDYMHIPTPESTDDEDEVEESSDDDKEEESSI